MFSYLFTPAPLAGREPRRMSAAAPLLEALSAAARRLRLWYRRQVTIHRLQELDDHMLKDIGLGRSEIDGLVRNTDPDRGHRFPVRDRARFL